jgi:hypothetical protein
MVGVAAVAVLYLGTAPLGAQRNVVGQWDGVITILGSELGITVAGSVSGGAEPG